MSDTYRIKAMNSSNGEDNSINIMGGGPLTRIEQLENSVTSINNNISSMHTYSFDEQIVGTWVDGKTLYRKSFAAEFTTNTDNVFSLRIENIDRVWIDMGATFIYNDNSWGAHSTRQPWLTTTVSMMYATPSSVYFNTSLPSGNILFTVLYTKNS